MVTVTRADSYAQVTTPGRCQALDLPPAPASAHPTGSETALDGPPAADGDVARRLGELLLRRLDELLLTALAGGPIAPASAPAPAPEAAPQPPAPLQPPRLTAKERETLEAFGKDSLGLKQVAARLGTPHKPALQARLTKLRKCKALDHDGTGYFVTGLGRQALKAEG
jgi:hypothetical protein